MDPQHVIVGTRHGIYPVHRHWLDIASCMERWAKAGKPLSPRSGPYVIDLKGYLTLPPGITA